MYEIEKKRIKDMHFLQRLIVEKPPSCNIMDQMETPYIWISFNMAAQFSLNGVLQIPELLPSPNIKVNQFQN